MRGQAIQRCAARASAEQHPLRCSGLRICSSSPLESSSKLSSGWCSPVSLRRVPDHRICDHERGHGRSSSSLGSPYRGERVSSQSALRGSNSKRLRSTHTIHRITPRRTSSALRRTVHRTNCVDPISGAKSALRSRCGLPWANTMSVASSTQTNRMAYCSRAFPARADQNPTRPSVRANAWAPRLHLRTVDASRTC